MLKNYSLKIKLIIAFLIIGTIPLLTSNIISFYQSQQEINNIAFKMAESVAKDRAHRIVSYFDLESSAIIDMANNEMTLNAIEDFSKAFAENQIDSDLLQKQKQAVLKYFEEDFGGMYSKQTNKKFEVSNIANKLDPLAIIAQHDFIVNNDNPLGSKDLLTSPKRESTYGAFHTRYHPFFRSYLVRHSLYDLFLVDPNGRIVYSVFKETDFGTSLVNGPWAESGLAQAFTASKNLKSAELHIADFATYTPSYEAPASFAATPIFKSGKYIGSILIQLPLDKISAVAAERDGLGEKGETILLGSDLRLRANTFRNPETHNVALSYKENSTVSLDSKAVQLASQGLTGSIKNVSYDGLKTLAYYMPITIQNLKWYVITELSEDEVFAGLNTMIYSLVSIILLSALLIIGFATFFGSSLSNLVTGVANRIVTNASQVATTSTQIAGASQELSQAVTEQASSLQETAASLEEMTSMISKSSQNAAVTSESSLESQNKAKEGGQVVQDMLASMNEITQSNEDILSSVTESSRQMAEIVKVIQDIGERTKVINEIVFQTKLLSFNASVEAARAGEHGKGFAVVAEEVGNLAQMSGNAAQEITDMLNSSTAKVEGIVKETQSKVESLVQRGKEKVEGGLSVAQRCANM